jgi:uncharacterized membrane protein
MNNKFASGFGYYKQVWVFIVGSVLGTWYEEILNFILNGTYERRSSLFIGPFNIIYGFAFLIAVLLLRNYKRWYQIIFIGSLLGGLIEFFASYLQEFITGAVSWDYSNLFLNIDGRTTLPFMLYWGILIWFVVTKLYPFISKLIENIPIQFGKILTNTIVIFLVINIVFSGAIFIRRGLRIYGFEPSSRLGEYIDANFPDEFIVEYYPNLIIRK